MRLLFLAPVLLSYSNSAFAQDWMQSRNAEDCSIGESFSNQFGSTLVIVLANARGELFLSLSRPGWSVVDSQTYQVTIDFAGSSFTGPASAIAGRFSSDPSQLVVKVNESFLQNFSSSSYMDVFLGETDPIARLQLRGSARAVQVLRRCWADVIAANTPEALARAQEATDARDRLADPFAFGSAGPAEPSPIGPQSAWIGTEDYPSGSANQGRVSYRLTINRMGVPTDCVVTVGSGFYDLDAATCRLIRSRARFQPARAASGRYIEGTYSGVVNWAITQ